MLVCCILLDVSASEKATDNSGYSVSSRLYCSLIIGRNKYFYAE